MEENLQFVAMLLVVTPTVPRPARLRLLLQLGVLLCASDIPAHWTIAGRGLGELRPLARLCPHTVATEFVSVPSNVSSVHRGVRERNAALARLAPRVRPGDRLLFLDDDAVVHPDLFREAAVGPGLALWPTWRSDCATVEGPAGRDVRDGFYSCFCRSPGLSVDMASFALDAGDAVRRRFAEASAPGHLESDFLSSCTNWRTAGARVLHFHLSGGDGLGHLQAIEVDRTADVVLC